MKILVRFSLAVGDHPRRRGDVGFPKDLQGPARSWKEAMSGRKHHTAAEETGPASPSLLLRWRKVDVLSEWSSLDGWVAPTA